MSPILEAAVQNITIPFSQIPTPLVFVPPALAYQISVLVYLHIGATSVLIWDILNNLRNDFKLSFYYKVRLPTVIYYITRISLLAYCLGRCVLLTRPINDCTKFEAALNGLLVAFISSTTCFFYLRVSSIYNKSIFIVTFFGILWLATVAMSSLFFKIFSAAHVGPTQFCLESVNQKFLAPPAIVFLTNDTLIYAAITYRIYQMFLERDASLSEKVKLVVFGKSLPLLSKVILLDSQLYFLLIVLTKAFLVLAISSFDPPASAMFVICHLVLVNILSCRVYRNVRLGNEHLRARGESVELYGSGGITSVEFGEVKEGNRKATDAPPEVRTSTHTPDFQRSSANSSTLEPSAREEVMIEMSIHGHPSFFQGEGQDFKKG
ncbi:hypothetical protein GALMADRAFT_103363 [Galerina marginata CBS 339.88]|uniref:Uncharacterized protein n=1 Tax=Galerina marginata (strain CBS 339.88) TaxID=685588 RepID=A0A067SGX9_GALM3|nr:hypothetical protein GALMADRAFT_103363 [Galerina marginata CBS 339.88]